MQRRARENGAWIRVAFIKKYAGTVLGAALLLALAVFGITICKDLKGIENGAPLCPCPECVRNAVLALGEVLGE